MKRSNKKLPDVVRYSVNWFTKLNKSISFRLHKKTIFVTKDYLEGRISDEDFAAKFVNKRFYKRIYRRIDHCGFWGGKEFYKETRHKLMTQKQLGKILKFFDISFVPAYRDLYLYQKWIHYLPSYLEYENELLEKMESWDPNKEHTKEWHKEKWREEYPYEKYPPKWMQRPEWPMDGDKRCTFLYQTGNPNFRDYILYHFRKSNGEEVVIEQYD